MTDKIPRDKQDDYTETMAQTRRDFASTKTSTQLNHIGHYSVDPAVTAGNIENFIGVAQVPMGLMGPLLVDGEHAQGEFYVPMATSEGTLVASYNRGASLLREAGGAKVTVVDDAMGHLCSSFRMPVRRDTLVCGLMRILSALQSKPNQLLRRVNYAISSNLRRPECVI